MKYAEENAVLGVKNKSFILPKGSQGRKMVGECLSMQPYGFLPSIILKRLNKNKK